MFIVNLNEYYLLISIINDKYLIFNDSTLLINITMGYKNINYICLLEYFLYFELNYITCI